MNPALWAAKTGLDAQQTRMAVVSNNLANVNTTGFKKSRAVFEDLLYQNVTQVGAATSQNTQAASGLELGTGVRVVATEKTYTQGNLSQTGNAMDLAINGRGFFQVLMPDGTLGYTRAGDFQLNASGQLVTSSGYTLQPAITIPAGRAERDHRQRWHGQRAARRPVGTDHGRHRSSSRTSSIPPGSSRAAKTC
jgi:flagellar basal-body rod protein FlgG